MGPTTSRDLLCFRNRLIKSVDRIYVFSKDFEQSIKGISEMYGHNGENNLSRRFLDVGM